MKTQKPLRAVIKKQLWSAAPVAAGAAALLVLGNAAWARAGPAERGVRLIEAIPVTVSADNSTAGGMYSVDISWVDQATQTYYLADRSNKRVDIVDTKTNAFLGQSNASPSF